MCADNHGNTEGARDDRRVSRGPAGLERETEDLVQRELDRLRRQQVVCDQDDRSVELTQLVEVVTAQRMHDLSGDVDHIEASFREMNVFKRRETGQQSLHHLVKGPLGVHPLGPDDLFDRAGQ